MNPESNIPQAAPETKIEDKNIAVENQGNLNNSSTENKEEKPKSASEWDKFREARAAERKQAEEVARQAQKHAAEAAALKAALDSVLNKPAQTQQYRENAPSYGYDQGEETEEQRIDKRVAEALAKREAEAEKQRREREQREFPEKLNQTFKDFNQVCTTENLDYLEYHYPEVAEAFKYVPDGYNKWASVYQAVKRFVPNVDSKKDVKRAEANFNKPQSASSPSVTQTGEAMSPSRLDEQRKAANWQRMQRAMKGLT